MIVKLLTEHHLEFLSLKGVVEACPSLHMSKCHIVGKLMHWLNMIAYGVSITTKASDHRCDLGIKASRSNILKI